MVPSAGPWTVLCYKETEPKSATGNMPKAEEASAFRQIETLIPQREDEPEWAPLIITLAWVQKSIVG